MNQSELVSLLAQQFVSTITNAAIHGRRPVDVLAGCILACWGTSYSPSRIDVGEDEQVTYQTVLDTVEELLKEALVKSAIGNAGAKGFSEKSELLQTMRTLGVHLECRAISDAAEKHFRESA